MPQNGNLDARISQEQIGLSRPLARVVIGGLVTNKILTLLVLPLLAIEMFPKILVGGKVDTFGKVAKNWGTVWGTTVSELEFGRPKTTLSANVSC